MLQIADLNGAIKRHARKDAAAATKDAYQSARAKGPDALASLLRHVMKSGRKYKPPPLAPVIWDPVSQTFIDGDKALGDHFAKAEHATQIDPADIATPACNGPPQDLQIDAALSVPALARSFQQLAHRKSPGLSGLPAEVYSQASVAAASTHAPLLLKVALRGQTPTLWRGGEVTAISKPQKSPHSVEGWRSILLMEAAAKGVGRALRPALLRGLQQLRQPGQGGSFPHEPLQWAMALIRGFTRRLKASKRTGGVLFVDGKQAFYATLRQALTGAESGCPVSVVEDLATRFFQDPQDRLDFVAAALGPGLLQASDVPEVVRRVAISSLQRTWYVHGKANRWTYETFSGTTPGAPLADLYFQFLMTLVFDQVNHQIAEHCIEPWCPGAQSDGSFRMLAPSWMDDWALPLVPPEPEQLLPQAATLVGIVNEALATIGIEINYAAGKTELVPILAGKGSKLARIKLLEQNDTFEATLRRGSTTVRVVPQYEHLGSIISWDASDKPDILHRRILARSMFRALRKVLSNGFLSARERADLLVSMPLARLRHGAGLWAFRHDSEMSAFATAYMELVRRSFRAITGITSRGRTDDEVCLGLGVLTPRQARCADIVRHAAWLLSSPDEAMFRLWFQDGAWLSNLQEALHEMARLFRQSDITFAQLRQRPGDGKLWARRFTKLCRKQQDEGRRSLLPAWQGQQKAIDHGWIFVHVDTQQIHKTRVHACPRCERTFLTRAACCSHLRKVHKVAAAATQAIFGTRCERCSKEFWSEGRLREHFRTHPTCLQVAREADIDPVSVTLRSAPKAWRPAVTVPGPQPWWATLQPQVLVQDEPAVFTSGWGLLQGILKRGDRTDLHGFVQSVLAVAVRHRLTVDDAPLAVLTGQDGALLMCILFTAEQMYTGNAGQFCAAPWQVLACRDRAIFIPLGGNLQVKLPSEWRDCWDLLK